MHQCDTNICRILIRSLREEALCLHQMRYRIAGVLRPARLGCAWKTYYWFLIRVENDSKQQWSSQTIGDRKLGIASCGMEHGWGRSAQGPHKVRTRRTAQSANEPSHRPLHTSEWTATSLRISCGCAQCVEEWSRRQLLDPASVPLDLKAEDYLKEGRYAVQFLWLSLIHL